MAPDEDDEEEDEEEIPINENPEQSDNLWERILESLGEVEKHFPYNLLNERYLRFLSSEFQSYRVRVYLISA